MSKQATAGMLIALALLAGLAAVARSQSTVPRATLGQPSFNIFDVASPDTTGVAFRNTEEASKAGTLGYVLWELASPSQVLEFVSPQSPDPSFLPDLPMLPGVSPNG